MTPKRMGIAVNQLRRHHLRRPHAGRGEPLNQNASYTVNRSDPFFVAVTPGTGLSDSCSAVPA